MKIFLEGEYGRRRGGPRLLLVAAALALAARAPSQKSSSSPTPIPSISLPSDLDRVLRDYEKAWAARDAVALAALFTEDGFVLQGGKPPVRGREAIRAAYDGTRRAALPPRLRVRRRGRDRLHPRRLFVEAGRARRRQVHAHAAPRGGRALEDRVGHGQRQSPAEEAAVNPLLDDRDVEFILDELLDVGALAALPYFADHDRETLRLVLDVRARPRARHAVPGVSRARRAAAAASRAAASSSTRALRALYAEDCASSGVVARRAPARRSAARSCRSR